jgi:capsular exopolysaccharide synthesis family protein
LSAATENIRLARDRALNLSSQLQQLQESRATRYFDLQQYRAELELSLLQPQDTGITLVDSPVSIAATTATSTFFSSVQLPLGAAAGFLLGCLAVLLKAQISQAAGSPAQLRSRLGMTVLGVIPRVRRSRHSSRTAAVERDSLIFSEAMQLVGASLSGPLNHGSRSLLVTSAVPREGKTAVTVQLARVLSQYGHRVIVVDANLRKPEVAQRLDLSQQEGLATALARQQNPVDYIVETPSFAVIPGGQSPPNPVELLSLPGMASLIQQLQNRYDVVLVDAAPAIGFAEVRALANLVSGAILVVKGVSTSIDLVSKGQEELEAAGVPLVGAVINFAPDEECTHLKHDNYRPSKTSNGTGRRSNRSAKPGNQSRDEQPDEAPVPSLTLR